MNAIYVVATNKAKEGSADKLREVLTAMIEPTRKEDGCIQYSLFADKDGKTFVFFEQWASREALEAHTKTAHFAKLSNDAPALLEAPSDLKILNLIV
jgi:quinol monooxygenase YgiN